MILQTKLLSLELDEKTGSIRRLASAAKTLTSAESGQRPLFSLRLIDPAKRFYAVNAFDAQTVMFLPPEEPTGSRQTIRFADFRSVPGLQVVAGIHVCPDLDQIEWTLRLDNQSADAIEYVDYPQFTVPNDLGCTADQAKIFWPYTEGCLVEDITRPRFQENPLLYPSNASEAMYPGAITMQFMAYYDQKAGLYFAAQDTTAMPKSIECFPCQDGIRLAIKSFICVAPQTAGQLNFPLVMRLYAGGWLEAAELYREFVENAAFPLPSKLHRRENLPAWQKQSPVVGILPPRTIRGSGYMGPNEFFPWPNALKYLDDLAEAIDTQLMAFLTYWEGSAPWCPPFIWPPYGGEAPFQAFVDQMHARGHLVGVYGSGLQWTDQSLLCPEYDQTQYRIDHDLTRCMCASPAGELSSRLCQTIRRGFEMCPACAPTKEIALEQFESMLAARIDFIQYFDQNIGGRGYFCYADDHGHPPMYGPWSVEAMRGIYRLMVDKIAQYGHRSAIGAESSASDCFIEQLTFNDLRYNWVFASGKPVPAFAYVFHEYNVNFMGNQCAFTQTIPVEQNPDSLLFRLAYSLIAGDLLTLVIKSGGEIHWEWGMSWLQPGPRQKKIIQAVRQYNALRNGRGHPYLQYGRMIKASPVSGGQPMVLTRADGSQMEFPGVLTSKWIAPDGSEAQIIANYQAEPVVVRLSAPCLEVFGAPGETINWQIQDQTTTIEVPPLSCVGALTKAPEG